MFSHHQSLAGSPLMADPMPWERRHKTKLEEALKGYVAQPPHLHLKKLIHKSTIVIAKLITGGNL